MQQKNAWSCYSVETPTDIRVKRWGLSFEDLLGDPSGNFIEIKSFWWVILIITHTLIINFFMYFKFTLVKLEVIRY